LDAMAFRVSGSIAANPRLDLAFKGRRARSQRGAVLRRRGRSALSSATSSTRESVAFSGKAAGLIRRGGVRRVQASTRDRRVTHLRSRTDCAPTTESRRAAGPSPSRSVPRRADGLIPASECVSSSARDGDRVAREHRVRSPQ
jgi:hypothetical protein